MFIPPGIPGIPRNWPSIILRSSLLEPLFRLQRNVLSELRQANVATQYPLPQTRRCHGLVGTMISCYSTQLAHTDVMDPGIVLGAQICLGSLPPPCS
jgi:hypothetical protein